MSLNKNEGIYVRDIRSGQVKCFVCQSHMMLSCDPQVRSVMGPVLYMLEAYEELYSKELEPLVEEILK